MSLWVIVPVKPLNRAKSRLANALSPEVRQKLAEMMFRHVLSVVTNVKQVTGTLVVSRDPKALAIAREYGAKTVQETSAPELNAALTRASELINLWDATTSLVLPADLPLLAEQDIREMYEMCRGEPSVIIAPDKNGCGTNALLLRPPGIIPYSFGEDSMRGHAALAREAGVPYRIYRSKRLQLDIDCPEDIRRYTELAEEMGFEPLPMPLKELDW
ncbi:MAG: 2-phospho-L-lactate guanylyltransferase [Chloroflexi bacterium]|nr:MAG: 2-phospho-L-lactate guanylyltransferase [Chloroflexota bacterium]